jgi:hypothetical protein
MATICEVSGVGSFGPGGGVECDFSLLAVALISVRNAGPDMHGLFVLIPYAGGRGIRQDNAGVRKIENY